MAEYLTSTIAPDAITDGVSRYFDYSFDGETKFKIPDMVPMKGVFQVGLIVGPSGSGKSTLLEKHYGKPKLPDWDNAKAICQHFKTAEKAAEMFAAVGLNSVPTWMKPRNVLSTGEGFRADMARMIKDGATVDEFTSVVDRNVAKSAACAISRHIKENGICNVVFATCHYDVIEWLSPDWVYDTAQESYLRGRFHRPEIIINVEPCSVEEWRLFRPHHYLSGDINRGAHCWLAKWKGVTVGFAASLAFPNQAFTNAWRGHRTVVLPDFQGLGIGPRLSDAIGEMHLSQGKRYFSKTAHPRLGEYREKSPLWKPTSKNKKARMDYAFFRETKESGHKMKHADRLCYSHEYIGAQA